MISSIAGVEKRLDADAPLGFLLSAAGWIARLVCAIAAKLLKEAHPHVRHRHGREDAIDLKYAREVADYIHSDHTEVIITKGRCYRKSRNRHCAAWHV